MVPVEKAFSIVEDPCVEEPCAIEEGYNGAWGARDGLKIGQSFRVLQTCSLISATMRLSGNNVEASGIFDVNVYEFSETTAETGAKLASIPVDVDSLPIGLQNISPIDFVFPGADVTLSPEKSYLLTIEPRFGFLGDVTSQAATDIYSCGHFYYNEGQDWQSYPGQEENEMEFCINTHVEPVPIQNPDNGHWYQRFDNFMTWHDAKAHCESMDGYLATITSQQENDFVFDNLVYPIGDTCWLGGTDEDVEGVWQWVTGEAWEYSNWEPGEPNNACGGEDYACGGEDYLHIYDGTGWWNDEDNDGFCGGGLKYPICEWDHKDTTPPLVEHTGTDPGPPKSYEVTCQDMESGLAEINVIAAKNFTVDIPPFDVGTNDPVILTVTKVDQTKSSFFDVEVIDVAGNVTRFDPEDDPETGELKSSRNSNSNLGCFIATAAGG
jgi:hypothetical protein